MSGTRWYLLGEDQSHERFARKLARQLGLNEQPIDFEISPKGRGAASGWVLANYASRVRAWIRKRPGQRVVLLVLIDGDNEGPARRHREFEHALREDGQPARSTTEPIVIMVPTWSIDTWLAPPSPEITEAQDLKSFANPTNRDFEAAVTRVRNLSPNEHLDSVRLANLELERIPR